MSAGGNWTSIRGCWSGTKPYQSRSQQPHQLYRSQSHTEANHNGAGQLGSTFKYQFWSLQLHYGYSLVRLYSNATELNWEVVVSGGCRSIKFFWWGGDWGTSQTAFIWIEFTISGRGRKTTEKLQMTVLKGNKAIIRNLKGNGKLKAPLFVFQIMARCRWVVSCIS